VNFTATLALAAATATSDPNHAAKGLSPSALGTAFRDAAAIVAHQTMFLNTAWRLVSTRDRLPSVNQTDGSD
jgi:hypothetical protein